MTTLEWIIYSSCGIAFLCILIGAINDLRHLKSKTMKYLTQLDEIDQWLADNFGILPGACASTENLRYNTARMVVEALWPKCKDSLHIPETCKENGDSFTNDIDSERVQVEEPSRDQVDKLEEVAEKIIYDAVASVCKTDNPRAFCQNNETVFNVAKAVAKRQREQFHDACRQCEKNFDNVFYKGEQHAIKMMEKETISGEVVQNYSGEYALYIKAKLPNGTYLKFGDKVPVYIFKKNTL